MQATHRPRPKTPARRSGRPIDSRALRDFLAAAGFATLKAWAEASGVRAQLVYQSLSDGSPLSPRVIGLLADSARVPPELTRTILARASRRGAE